MQWKHRQQLFIGRDIVRNYPVSIGYEDFLRHMYLVGKTGTGKTTLQTSLVLQMIYADQGVCYIDPHGDAVERILEYIPENRLEDVIYFDPSDGDHPISYNPIANVPEGEHSRITSGVVSALEHIFGGNSESWPRIHNLLYNTIYALVDAGGESLAGIMRMIEDEDYRERILRRVDNGEVRRYWEIEYAAYSKRGQAERTESTRSRIRQLLIQPEIRSIINQCRNKLDLRQIMDDQKILLVNLSKGKIETDATRLLGGLLVHGIKAAAMSRADTPEVWRPFYGLVVDEFQNFGEEVFMEILSEARKYHLGLLLGHQYVNQVSQELKNAIVGNAGSLVSFRIGYSDAVELAEELDYQPAALIGLAKYTARVRLINDSESLSGTLLRTEDLPFGVVGQSAWIRENTRRRYCKRPASVTLGKRKIKSRAAANPRNRKKITLRY